MAPSSPSPSAALIRYPAWRRALAWVGRALLGDPRGARAWRAAFRPGDGTYASERAVHLVRCGVAIPHDWIDPPCWMSTYDQAISGWPGAWPHDPKVVEAWVTAVLAHPQGPAWLTQAAFQVLRGPWGDGCQMAVAQAWTLGLDPNARTEKGNSMQTVIYQAMHHPEHSTYRQQGMDWARTVLDVWLAHGGVFVWDEWVSRHAPLAPDQWGHLCAGDPGESFIDQLPKPSAQEARWAVDPFIDQALRPDVRTRPLRRSNPKYPLGRVIYPALQRTWTGTRHVKGLGDHETLTLLLHRWRPDWSQPWQGRDASSLVWAWLRSEPVRQAKEWGLLLAQLTLWEGEGWALAPSPEGPWPSVVHWCAQHYRTQPLPRGLVEALVHAQPQALVTPEGDGALEWARRRAEEVPEKTARGSRAGPEAPMTWADWEALGQWQALHAALQALPSSAPSPRQRL